MAAVEEPAGLEALYLSHKHELLRFLTARTGDADEAQDVLQEVWLKAQRAEAGPIGNARAYLYRIAQNLVLDRAREHRRRVARNRAWQTDALGIPLDGTEIPDQRNSAESEMIQREEIARLASAIAALPEGARRAFRLHKIDGLKHSEVAEALGISISAVEKHIALAMKHLRRTLAD